MEKFTGMDKFLTVERNATSITVANQIIQMIANGELKAGEKLPSERQLQELLKVGRPSVREALSALQIMNICETRIGDGTYITSLDAEHMTKPFEIIMLLSKPNLIELFEMRELLEVGAIRLAAKYVTDDEAAELVRLATLGPSLIDKPKEFVKVDGEIHLLIANASQNSVIKNVMYGLKRMIHISRDITTTFIEVRRQAADDHIDIVNALVSRDVNAAEESMRRHLQNVLRIVTTFDKTLLASGILSRTASE